MQVPLQAEIFRRVVRIDGPNGSIATGFTIDRGGSQWLVSARHVLEPFEGTDVTVSIEHQAVELGVRCIPGVHPHADIAVIRLDSPITVDFPVGVRSTGVAISQQVFFLGFPHGLGGVASFPGSPNGVLAFVKAGVLSALHKKGHGSESVLLIDGHNNPGFSGGPVCFHHMHDRRWSYAGVVSGYRTEEIPQGVGRPTVTATANSGIVVAYDVNHAVDAIDAL